METKLGRKSFTSGQAEERHFVYPKITVSKSDSLIDTFSDTKEFGKMSEALLINQSSLVILLVFIMHVILMISSIFKSIFSTDVIEKKACAL